jgi:hypothetical protein
VYRLAAGGRLSSEGEGLASAFSPAEVRRAQVEELRSSLDSAQKTLKDSRSSLARDPFPSRLERARRGRWAELDRSVGRAKSQNASRIERCAKAAAKVDRAMNLRFDYAEGAKLFDEDIRRKIGERLPKSVKESPSVKAFLAGRRSRFDPGDAATSVTAAALGEAWPRPNPGGSSLQQAWSCRPGGGRGRVGELGAGGPSRPSIAWCDARRCDLG